MEKTKAIKADEKIWQRLKLYCVGKQLRISDVLMDITFAFLEKERTKEVQDVDINNGNKAEAY